MGNKGSKEWSNWSNSVEFRNERDKRIKHKRLEREEQMEVFRMPHDCKVVELGARYGTVSCALSSHLNDPTQHIAVEADRKVWDALARNRESNQCEFTQVNGVIADAPLCLNEAGYSSTTIECDAADADAVPNFTLEELGAEHYTCLVADCEGCTPDFLRSNPTFASNLKYVTIEMDGTPDQNAETRDMLRWHGLTREQSKDSFRETWVK